jgi:hypothetical protein
MSEASTPLLPSFSAALISYQLVPPFNKRANKAERAIQTFKRHFIAVLSCTHPSFQSTGGPNFYLKLNSLST